MKKIGFIIISIFLFLSACSSANENLSQSESVISTETQPAQAQKSNNGGGGGGRQEEQSLMTQQISLDQSANNKSAPTVTERKIIRNADLKIETNSPEESQQKITQIADSKNGFVIETSQTNSNVQTTTRDVINMTIRVPAAKFDEAMTEIRATGNRVIQETVKGQDVTEEFIDIEARLKAQRALEEQFLEIMKRATAVEDALNVQRELANVRGEIEKIEGRKRFLENQSSLSTIKIVLQTPTSLSASPSGFFYELKEALSTGFNAALKIVLFFVMAAIALAPFFILIVFPLYLLWRYYRKNRTVKQTPVRVFNDDLKGE